jgi:hypothetical protein
MIYYCFKSVLKTFYCIYFIEGEGFIQNVNERKN